MPDVAWLNWVWGKRCRMCRARYCRACVNREVRQSRSESRRRHTQCHETGHALLRDLDLADRKLTATLGRYEPDVTYGPLSRSPGAFVVGGRVYANVVEAVAETFTMYVLQPKELSVAARRWIIAKLTQSAPPHWRESVAELRKDADWSAVDADYRCGHCGHEWREFGGVEGG